MTRSRRISASLILLALSLMCSSAPASAQVDETTKTQSNLFEKFSEIARSAENRGDYSLAVAMYESAMERTNTSKGHEHRIVDTLARIANCYTQLGYYWRVEPVVQRILGTVEPQPRLYNQRVSKALTEYANLLRNLNKDAQAESYVQLNHVLANSQAHWSQSQATSSVGQTQ